ncbi:MAG: hypothetical protein MRERC_5c064 [Mycoplasmataceae bacterium RC_NB112A]|nr:MAG: hypothetical protein MRERC_5c064 [Mycoplasmataceae bacterium RC_NB112A]
MPSQNCVECGKIYEEDTYHYRIFGGRYDKSFGSYLCDECRKSEGWEIIKKRFEQDENLKQEKELSKIEWEKIQKNKNINNIMTNTSNTNTNTNKIYILEWESAELKDETMRCENFKVITGSEKENLLFYSTFFMDDNKFKKGEIYQLSTSGNFVQDTSGTIPGSFDASGIIQGIDSGGYEFEKITPSLFIKGLLERNERISLLEKDLKEKKEFVDRVNQESLETRKELSDLQSKFSKLQLEKEEKIKEIGSLKEELAKKQKEVEEKNSKISTSQQEIDQVITQLNNIKYEKNKIENSWVEPERYAEEEQVKEKLDKEKKELEKSKQRVTDQFEAFRNRDWRIVIEEKLQEKKSILNHLKVAADSKLESSQKIFLEMLLINQEQLDSLIFEGVDARICLPTKNQLKQTKEKLSALKPKEKDELCKAQTEVTKLQNQLNQWDRVEEIQLQQEYFEVPPKNN